MFSFLSSMPRFLQIAAAVILIALFLGAMSGIRSCSYQKAKAEYEASDKKHQEEYDRLAGENKELKKQREELLSQAAAYKAAAEAGKKVDEGLEQKIDEVSKETANAQANAETATDCRTRAERICNMFRTSDKRFNCNILFDECK